MATISKKTLSRQVKAIDADAIAKQAHHARKVAQEQAGVARRRAQALGKRAGRSTRAASRHADARREAMMERVMAGVGIAVSMAPVLTRAVVSNPGARRRMAKSARHSAHRINPLVLGASLAGAGWVGYRMWKRRHPALDESLDASSLDDDPVEIQHARMDHEGLVPGAYEGMDMHISRN